jgi:putative transposase
MPRHSRAVFPGVPHHVTQRGNHRERVFFEDGDAEAYRCLLHAYVTRHEVEVSAYCLMPNHVHLVVVPTSSDGLHRAMRAVHSQYAQRVNRMRTLSGHLWQGRYFSSPLDPTHYLNAVRYVELNPVRAGMVVRAEDYSWSSAAAHCGRCHDPLLARTSGQSQLLSSISDWSRWLSEGVPAPMIDQLREHARRNLPCGSTEFINMLEGLAGRELRCKPQGGQLRERR